MNCTSFKHRFCAIWNFLSMVILIMLLGSTIAMWVQKPPATVIDVSKSPLVLGMDRPSQLILESPGSFSSEEAPAVVGATWLESTDGQVRIQAPVEFSAGEAGQRKAILVIIPVLPPGHYMIKTDVLYKYNPLKTAKIEVILARIEVV